MREYFPAAVDAFADLDAPGALELLGKAPDPPRAARLTRAQVSAALKRARRRDIPGKATAIPAALRSPQLGQPPAVTAAYAVTARSLIEVITVLNEQVKALESQVEADFGRHPDAEIYLSQPGLGLILGAWSSASSATTRTGTPAARPARTTLRPPRSPARRGRRRPSCPGSSATTGSPTR